MLAAPKPPGVDPLSAASSLFGAGGAPIPPFSADAGPAVSGATQSVNPWISSPFAVGRAASATSANELPGVGGGSSGLVGLATLAAVAVVGVMVWANR